MSNEQDFYNLYYKLAKVESLLRLINQFNDF